MSALTYPNSISENCQLIDRDGDYERPVRESQLNNILWFGFGGQGKTDAHKPVMIRRGRILPVR